VKAIVVAKNIYGNSSPSNESLGLKIITQPDPPIELKEDPF
jgi:hypothetical protein